MKKENDVKRKQKKRYVYELVHSRITRIINGEEIRTTKGIGIFSTMKKAKDTIEKYKGIKGFCDFPDDFYITKKLVPAEATEVVYIAEHEYEEEDEEYGIFDYVTDLGIFGSREEAEEAVEKARKRKKFKKYPDGFTVAKCQLDKCDWPQGFTIWDPDSIGYKGEE